MLRVAVSPVLSHIQEYLREEGIEVVSFENKNFARLPEVSAIVISGGDKNFLGSGELETMAPVINAEGRTAEEISGEIKERFL